MNFSFSAAIAAIIKFFHDLTMNHDERISALEANAGITPPPRPEVPPEVAAHVNAAAPHPSVTDLLYKPNAETTAILDGRVGQGSSASVDETKLELGAVGDGRHPRVDVEPGKFVDKAFGPYAAGTRFVIQTVGDVGGGAPGNSVGIEVRSGDQIVATGTGDMECRAVTGVVVAVGGAHYVARIFNRDTLPITCHVQVNKA